MDTSSLRYITDEDRRAVLVAVPHILEAGYAISVSDGEERVLAPSTDAQAIISAMGSTESDLLSVWTGSLRIGTFAFVWGMTDAEETIADYSWRASTVGSQATMDALYAAITHKLAGR